MVQTVTHVTSVNTTSVTTHKLISNAREGLQSLTFIQLCNLGSRCTTEVVWSTFVSVSDVRFRKGALSDCVRSEINIRCWRSRHLTSVDLKSQHVTGYKQIPVPDGEEGNWWLNCFLWVTDSYVLCFNAHWHTTPNTENQSTILPWFWIISNTRIFVLLDFVSETVWWWLVTSTETREREMMNGARMGPRWLELGSLNGGYCFRLSVPFRTQTHFFALIMLWAQLNVEQQNTENPFDSFGIVWNKMKLDWE